MMRQLLLTAWICLLGWQFMQCQCVPSASDFLYGPNVKALIHNGGDMFWDLVGNPQYEVPRVSPTAVPVHSAFASSLWIGGLDNGGNLRLAGQTYRQAGIDFYTGPYRTTGIYPCNNAPINFAMDPSYTNGMIKLASGKVVIQEVNQVQIYDPATSNILTRTLPLPRTNYLPVELNDGRVWLVGQDMNSGLIPVETFIMDTATWTISTYLLPNHFHFRSTMTKLNDGRILVAGRQGCEILDPTTNQLTSVAGLIQPRTFHSATLLSNGRVMVAGGNTVSYNSVPTTATTEIYDPTSNTWTAGPNMLGNRSLPTLTLMPNTNVLITGGQPATNQIQLYVSATNQIGFHMAFPHNMGLNTAFIDDDFEIYFLAKGWNTGGDGLLIHKYDIIQGKLDNLQMHMSEPGGVYLGNYRALVKQNYPSGEFVILDTHNDVVEGDRYQKLWKVSRSEIQQFQADFAGGSVNFQLYPDIETWPAHGDVGAGEPFYLAPFIDVNGDGRYRPAVDGDYPCIKGDNAMWWVYNDAAGTHSETGGLEMGLQFEVMAYTYDCATRTCPDSLLDYSTFYHYKVTNMSSSYLQDAYMGYWMDVDLGTYFDDYIGCDTALDLAFVYNGVDPDPMYGPAPPALGSMILKTPQNLGMTNFMTYNNDFTVNGNPVNAQDYYHYLQSRFLDGNAIVNNGTNGHPDSAAGTPTTHFFTGDPGFCGSPASGWSEVSAVNPPGDRRYLQSFGPFRLSAGEVMEVDAAVLWARGNSNLNSVCRLKDFAATTKPWWHAQDSACPTVILGQDDPFTHSQKPLLRIAPNPSTGFTTVYFPETIRVGELGVWNSMGQLVFSSPINRGADQMELSLPNLPAGLYHIIAAGNGQKMHTTWVVER